MAASYGYIHHRLVILYITKAIVKTAFGVHRGMLIPTRDNWLLLKDAYYRPLKNVAIYVYQISQAPVQDSGAIYFSDRPRFTGQTDSEGRFIFPNVTDANWDDPETEIVDGAVEV